MTTHPHHRLVGLTGGIGSGKSTVARLLAARGACVVDADAVAKSITQPGGSAIEPIRHAFGPQFITNDGAMDRDAMRQHVFEHPEARATLEAITHPLVRRAMTAAWHAAPPGLVVLDIPLLVESGTWAQAVDCVVVVDCLEATQVQRVMQRNGWTEAAVQRVMAAQASRQQRLAVADAVIFNDGLTLDELGVEVDQLAQWLGI